MESSTSAAQQIELEAATELWEPLAAYSWDQFVAFGTGVILLERDDLLRARNAQRAGSEPRLEPGYVPLSDIPPGDDFRTLLSRLDPRRQIALLIRRADDADRDDAEQFYVLEMIEGKRPSPEDCYFARERPSG